MSPAEEMCLDFSEALAREVGKAIARERAACAALCREAGCICRHLYAAFGADDSLEWGGRFRAAGTLDGLVVMGELEVHDPRCPIALAVQIEARGGEPRKE